MFTTASHPLKLTSSTSQVSSTRKIDLLTNILKLFRLHSTHEQEAQLLQKNSTWAMATQDHSRSGILESMESQQGPTYCYIIMLTLYVKAPETQWLKSLTIAICNHLTVVWHLLSRELQKYLLKPYIGRKWNLWSTFLPLIVCRLIFIQIFMVGSERCIYRMSNGHLPSVHLKVPVCDGQTDKQTDRETAPWL